MAVNTFVAAVLALALLVPFAASAHEGHAHKFMGTVLAVREGVLEVKATDGKTVTFVLDARTVYQRGKAKSDPRTMQVGERVVVTAMPVSAGKTMTAQTVQLPVPAAAAAAR
jgi:hypothetical protein